MLIMDFNFIDSRTWKYNFHIDEDNLSFVDFTVEMGSLGTCSGSVAFYDDVFLWQSAHVESKSPIFSIEAKEFCERKIISLMKMKAFW